MSPGVANYFTTSLSVVVGLCLAFGVLFMFVGLTRARRRTIDLLFAGFSFAYGGATLMARNHYLADTADQARAWDRYTVIMASLAFILLLWFVAAYTHTSRGRARWAIVPLTVVFAVAMGIGLGAPDLLRGEEGNVDTVVLPWGEQVLVASGDDAVVDSVLLLAQLLAMGLIVVLTVHQFRRGDRQRAAFLAIGLGWFGATLVGSLLVDAGVIDFVYVSDIGFVGFVVATSLELAKSTLDTEEELLGYQHHLRSMVDQRTAELKSAQTDLIARAAQDATMAERNRLARDLHDAVTQLLFSINLVAQSLPRLWDADADQAKRSSAELSRLARGALAEMRTLLRELRPQTIVTTDLPTLLKQLTESVAARFDLDVTVAAAVRPDPPRDVHVAVYRIAQEAINNAAKHADARTLSVRMAGDPQGLRLRVSDDGHGFDPQRLRSPGMGLDIMRERADAIGAVLTVSSDADGTVIALDWARPEAAAVVSRVPAT